MRLFGSKLVLGEGCCCDDEAGEDHAIWLEAPAMGVSDGRESNLRTLDVANQHIVSAKWWHLLGIKPCLLHLLACHFVPKAQGGNMQTLEIPLNTLSLPSSELLHFYLLPLVPHFCNSLGCDSRTPRASGKLPLCLH